MSGREKLKALYDKLIPPYARLPLWVMLIVNVGGYELFKLMTFGREPYDLTIGLDRLIPVIPATVLIYFGSFAFWFFGYIIAARIDEKKLGRFFAADILVKLFCFLIFFIMPTARTRPEIAGEGFFVWLLRLLYAIDTPLGLFPSLHCLNSWICFMGVRSEKSVPLWYKIFACVMSAAVFAATLTTAQHVIADVFAGVAVGELFWFLTRFRFFRSWADRLIPYMNKKKDAFFGLFKRKEKPEGEEINEKTNKE